jgi:hypothetical protein
MIVHDAFLRRNLFVTFVLSTERSLTSEFAHFAFLEHKADRCAEKAMEKFRSLGKSFLDIFPSPLVKGRCVNEEYFPEEIKSSDFSWFVKEFLVLSKNSSFCQRIPRFVKEFFVLSNLPRKTHFGMTLMKIELPRFNRGRAWTDGSV